MKPGPWYIDDTLTFTVNIHDPETGGVIDADSVPTYRLYEDETATPILTGSMAKLDDANTTGFYSEQITLSAANGFEEGKSYTIRITATVNGVTAALVKEFKVIASTAAGDWSAGEKEQIRYRLQLDGTQTAPAADAPLQMPVSADAISQDAGASDNLEAMLDGTRAKLYLSQLDIQASGTDEALKIVGVDNFPAIDIQGSQTGGRGISLSGEYGLFINGKTSGIFIGNTGPTGKGILIEGETDGVEISGFDGDGLKITGTVNDINADITGNLSGSIGSLATQAKADVNAEVAAQLLDKKLHLLISAAASMIDDVTAGSIIDQLADDGTAQFDRTTDSLQAIADNAGGGSLTAQEVRDAMKLAPTAGEPAAGSVDTHLDTIEAGIGGGTLTQQDVRNAMELASTAGATAEGSIDHQLVGISDKIGTPVALDGGAATIGGMLTKLADDANGTVYNAETDSQAAIAAGGALDDTLPELTAGEPPATPTIRQAIMLLYMALRNASSTVKTGENTGTRQIKNNAGSVIADADVSDDGTTFTQGKLGAP